MSRDLAIVLPGLDGTGELLEAFAARAPRSTECLVIRYPVDETLDYDALTEFVLKRVPADRRLVLIAESFSGPIAVRVAERMHDQVMALVLCNSFVTLPRLSLLRFCARAVVFRIPLPERILAAMMLAPLATPALTSAFVTAIHKVAPTVLAGRVRQMLTVDDRTILGRVQLPIIYLRGTLDRLVPEKALLQIVQAAPSVRVHRIRAPHAILQTACGEVWAAIGHRRCVAHSNEEV